MSKLVNDLNDAEEIALDAMLKHPKAKLVNPDEAKELVQTGLKALTDSGFKIEPPDPPIFLAVNPGWWRRNQVVFKRMGKIEVVARRWMWHSAFVLARRLEDIRRQG